MNSMVGRIRYFIPLIARDAVTWSICAIAALSPTFHLKTIQADFRLAYPSLVSEHCLKGDFHAEAMVPKTSKQRASF